MEDAQTTKQIRPVFVTTYSPWWTGLRKALTSQWNFIDTDPTLKKLFPEQPMIAYRKTRNVREYVSRAKLHANRCNNMPYRWLIQYRNQRAQAQG